MLDLNEFLNKQINCSCGKIHSTAVKLIDVDENATGRLAEHIINLGYHHIFMVCDVNTYEAAGKYAEQVINKTSLKLDKLIYEDLELVPDEKTVGLLFQVIDKEVDLILAVGSGTINDICKFSSYKLGLDYMVFASAPSMDGFVSVGAALLTDHVKTTYNAHVPVAVIADTNILAKAPMEMINAGLGDILGKYTCLLDWKIAHIIEDEYYCEEIVSLVRQAIEICVSEAKNIKTKSTSAVKAIMGALLLTGMAMSFVGNSRPASGSEHHLSHYWEMKFQMENKKPILHGIKVSIGMLAVIKMYEMLAKEKPDFVCLKNVGFDYTTWKNKVEECYLDAAKGIIKLEDDVKKNDIKKRNLRLDIMKDKWSEIVEVINNELPSLKAMEELLLDLDSPINPNQIGVDETLVTDAIILAKEVRNRFTILQVLWDLNLLNDYASKTTSYFSNSQKLYLDYVNKKNKEKINKIKMFVLDMDGTIYLDGELFSFTKDFLNAVKKSGKDYCFYTNNSSRNKNDYLKRLDNLGIKVSEDKMLLSTDVIINYLLSNYADKTYYIVGTPSLLEAFKKAGLRVVEDNPDCVIVGFDTTLTYEKVSKACHYIRNGAMYYGVNADYNCPMKDGAFIPDCGSIAKMIERSTDRFPIFFGKPSHYTLDYVVEKTSFNEDEICFVGDRIYTDIAVTQNSKATSIMVLTGESTIKDIEKFNIHPDMVVESLESLIKYL